MARKLVEGVDYYYDEHGRWIFTAHYLLKRGYCCKSGCKHCPYGFHKEYKKRIETNEKRKNSGSPDFSSESNN